MAKILLSFSAHLFCDGEFKIGCFYEGLINALAEEDNELLIVNSAEFLQNSWNGLSNKLPWYFNKAKIIDAVKQFSPDLVIAFNHCIPVEIEESCECPIILWDADSIPFWNAKDYVKKNISRYLFFGFSYESLDGAKNFGAADDKVFMIRPATSIKAEVVKKKYNISFIGTNFMASDSFVDALRNGSISDIRKKADFLIGKYYDNSDVNESSASSVCSNFDISVLSSVQNRVTILNSIQDIGLSIWGVYWIEIGKFLPWLAMCYIKDHVYSLKHNQDIYNASKLSISISHAQATKGFPWRVMDIMASDGCLVSDYRSGIEDFTKGYIDIPMFNCQYDARDLCKKLLKDDLWRNEVVEGSQLCIEEKGRWRHRLIEMEQILDLSLIKKANSDVALGKPSPLYLKNQNYLINKRDFISNVLADHKKEFAMHVFKRALVLSYHKLNSVLGITINDNVKSKLKSLLFK